MKGVSKESIEDLIRKNKLELAPTQHTLCIPIIDRIFRKMVAGIRFADIKVKDKMICDGHHRYVASHLANVPIGIVPAWTTSSTVVRDWITVLLATEDWDSRAKVKFLNEQDARFNNMSLDELVEKLK